MPKVILLNTTFICPYMKITLEGTCSLSSCPYYTSAIKSGCIWKYVSSKNSISIVELSIILGRDKKEILNIIKRAKLKIIKVVVKNKLIVKQSNIKYCYRCGKSYNIKREENGRYICNETCIDNKLITEIEKIYNKPISCVLLLLPTIMNLSTIAKLFKTSNKLIRQLYIAVFGDDSLLIRDRDLRKDNFKKRNKKINIRKTFNKRPKNLHFYTINKKIDNFKI